MILSRSTLMYEVYCLCSIHTVCALEFAHYSKFTNVSILSIYYVEGSRKGKGIATVGVCVSPFS